MSAPTKAETDLAFSRGYDAGNYGNAYESTDWESWYAEKGEPEDDDECADPIAFAQGMLLGFFSSYEIHEIGDEILAEEVAALRAQWGVES